jgi:putative molybdopterin biosynthesis protein
VFTFHEFVAPLVRRMAGLTEAARATVRATLPRRVAGERGRTEYLLVHLVEAAAASAAEPRYVAHPMGKGSGSVTAFARADGFVRIPGSVEVLERGEEVEVTLLGRGVEAAHLVVVGSHCVGLDVVLGRLARDGFRAKTIFVGSTAGLEAAARGECDVAPVHLYDPATGTYNRPFVGEGLRLLPGYLRRQAICHRAGDARFEGKDARGAVAAALADPRCRLQNRVRGSGTRALVDELVGDAVPAGRSSESRSHHAVAAAVAQGRADWGVCLERVALGAGLAVIPVREERYDFAVPAARVDRPAVVAFRRALEDPGVRASLEAMGFTRP